VFTSLNFTDENKSNTAKLIPVRLNTTSYVSTYLC